ncbi:MAG TPA: hypothetical protein VIM89_03850 [Mucilaginibacter sp.]
MSNQNLKPLQFLLPVFLIFTTTISFGQIRTSLMGGSGIAQLETYLSKKELLEEVKDSLEVMKKRALVSNNEALQVRCLYDLMRIRDMRTEDSLYFRNSAFMDTILRDQKSSAKMKALIYILQAQRLFGFNHKYLRFNAAAYRIKNSFSNYGALSPTQRDSLMYNDLDAALKLDPFQGDVSSLLWLSSNPDVFLFTPKFGDIIFSERINLTPRKYDDYYNETKQMIIWASLPSSGFRRILDSLALAPGEKEIFRSYLLLSDRK